MPFFSIILPTYNRAHLLGKALQSVIAQTFTDWELLVVDDGSTDHTRAVVAQWQAEDARIRYLWQENAERSAARNHGIRQAKGRYLCFLDSDDYYLPEHLACFHRHIMEAGCPKALFFGNTYEEQDGRRWPIPPPDLSELERNPVAFVLLNPVGVPRVCAERSLLLEFPFDPSLRISEDTELWARVLTRYPTLHYINAYTQVFVTHGGRTVGRQNLASYQANLTIKRQLVHTYRKQLLAVQRRHILHQAWFVLAQSHAARKCFWPMLFALAHSSRFRLFHRWKEKLYMIWEHLFIRN